jgi:enoyl-CoA hydratase/carnithine racemase
MNTRVALEIKDHIAHVRLSRPEKMNALDNDMIQAIISAGKQLVHEPAVRAVVLSGDGAAFCSGIDLDILKLGADGPGIDITTRNYGIANAPQQAVLQWRQLPVPVIAAVHGVAFGGGFQLCLGADMRVVHPATKMGMIEVKWGLAPDMCGMLLLRDLVRPDILAEITYAARVFDGATAVQWGVATKASDDPLAAAFELAKEIADKSPDAVRAAKRLLTMMDSALVERILKAESDEQLVLLSSVNHKEAVRAGLEKRAAIFTD